MHPDPLGYEYLFCEHFWHPPLHVVAMIEYVPPGHGIQSEALFE